MLSALDFFLQAVEESAGIAEPEKFSHLGEPLKPDDEVLDMDLDFRLQQLLAFLLQKNHELKLVGKEMEHSLDAKLREIGLSYAEIFLDPYLCPKEKIEAKEKESPRIKEKIDAIFASKEYAVEEMLPNLTVAGMMFRILVENEHGLSDVPFEIRGVKYIVIPQTPKLEPTEAKEIGGNRQVILLRVPRGYNPKNN